VNETEQKSVTPPRYVLFKRKGSHVWQCRFKWSGRTVRRSTNARTQAGAHQGAECWLKHYARKEPVNEQ
jgi:hypothetical protein